MIRIGIDLKKFFTVLNFFDDDVPVKFYMRRNSMETFYMRSDETRPTKIDFNLTSVDEQQIPKLSIDGKCRFNVNRKAFHSICREFNAIIEMVSITVTNDTMTFIAISKEIGIIEKSIDAKYVGKNPVKVQGSYDIGKILTFVDYIKNDGEIEIIMDKNFPLVLLFDVVKLGTMKVSFTPTETS